MSQHQISNRPIADLERQKFGAAVWDATNEDEMDPSTEDDVTDDTPEIPDDVPRPDPSKDQG
jgi:hypothetical protein